MTHPLLEKAIEEALGGQADRKPGADGFVDLPEGRRITHNLDFDAKDLAGLG